MYYDDLALSAGPEEGLKIRGARNILCRSWFEAALVYKRRIFSFKKLSARLLLMNQNSSDDGLSGCNMMILLSLSAGPEEGLKIRGHVKSDNLQYNMLVCWFTGTNDTSTKCLMFQVLFCSFIISCKIICNIVSIYLFIFINLQKQKVLSALSLQEVIKKLCLEHQTLGRQAICPSQLGDHHNVL